LLGWILLCSRSKFFYRFLLKRVSFSPWAASAALAARQMDDERSIGFMNNMALQRVGCSPLSHHVIAVRVWEIIIKC
jgi:hypothetical protein